jgi:hypothetical protein
MIWNILFVLLALTVNYICYRWGVTDGIRRASQPPTPGQRS